MKKLITVIMILGLSCNALAECDYSKIVKNPDGTYTYDKTLHICVGEMKRDLEIATEQNSKLTKALDLKDLVIAKADSRADLWKDTAFKLEDRISTIDSMRKSNEWLYYGLGCLTVFAAGTMAAKLINR